MKLRGQKKLSPRHHNVAGGKMNNGSEQLFGGCDYNIAVSFTLPSKSELDGAFHRNVISVSVAGNGRETSNGPIELPDGRDLEWQFEILRTGAGVH